MHVFEVVSKVIYAQHGWAVAEQFDETSAERDTETFDAQNFNALRLIRDTVKELVKFGPFDEDSTEELEEYYNDLVQYMDVDSQKERED
jgi:hypothetical protein